MEKGWGKRKVYSLKINLKLKAFLSLYLHSSTSMTDVYKKWSYEKNKKKLKYNLHIKANNILRILLYFIEKKGTLLKYLIYLFRGS